MIVKRRREGSFRRSQNRLCFLGMHKVRTPVGRSHQKLDFVPGFLLVQIRVPFILKVSVALSASVWHFFQSK